MSQCNVRFLTFHSVFLSTACLEFMKLTNFSTSSVTISLLAGSPLSKHATGNVVAIRIPYKTVVGKKMCRTETNGVSSEYFGYFRNLIGLTLKIVGLGGLL